MAKPSISIDSLKRFVPLSTLPDGQLKELREDVRVHRVPAKRILFKRGQATDKRFYLNDGAVDLYDGNQNVTPIRPGTFESHQPLDAQDKSYTGVTASDSTIVTVDKNKLDFLLSWSQSTSFGLTDLGESQKAEVEDDDDWMSALLRSNLFTQLPPTNIQKLFSQFQKRKVKAGEAVVGQGEEGIKFYVIRTGEARVTRQHPETGETETRAHLKPGDFFGEDALISDAPRNATVTMIGDGTLMYLDKQDFKALLHQPVLQYVGSSEIQRLKDEGNTVKLIDVRLAQEYDLAPSQDSVNIPLLELRKELDAFDSRDSSSTLSPDAIYVVCPEGGRRSEVATHLLKEAGLTAYISQQ